jgi:drug/metabolite transporter (DMT)-like permease
LQARARPCYLPAVREHLGELYSALCALLWAVAVVLFRKSGEQISPVALNAFKGAVALLLFLVTLLLLGAPLVPPERTAVEWGTLLLSGLLGIGVADSLFFASLNRLGASGSAVVDCIYAPFVVLSARLYLGEPLRPTLLGAVALMVVAIFVGTWDPPSAAAGAMAVRQRRIGVAYGIASMLLMAVGIVIAKPVLNVVDVWWATPVRVCGGQLLLIVQAVLPAHRADVRRAFTPSRLWWTSIPSAVIGSYLAMVVWIAGMKYTSAGVSGILSQMSTLFVPVLAALFLHERLTVRKVAGVLLGFAGALLATR